MPKREYDACHAARRLTAPLEATPACHVAAQDGRVGRPANETAVHGPEGRSTSGIQYGPAYWAARAALPRRGGGEGIRPLRPARAGRRLTNAAPASACVPRSATGSSRRYGPRSRRPAIDHNGRRFTTRAATASRSRAVIRSRSSSTLRSTSRSTAASTFTGGGFRACRPRGLPWLDVLGQLISPAQEPAGSSDNQPTPQPREDTSRSSDC